jgi:opacity protein-like surface antigen
LARHARASGGGKGRKQQETKKRANQMKENMKLIDIRKSPLAVMGGIAMLAVCATTAQAGDVSSGWYMSTDGGLNMMPGIRGESGKSGSEIRLDPGMRWGLEGGYGFSLSPKLTLGAELESGILWNSLNSRRHGVPSTENAINGDLYQVPMLANAILNYHIGKWTPYLGAGGGLEYLDANSHGAKDDFGPAMQGEAGVRYSLSEKAEVGLGYKYLAAFSEKVSGDRLSSVQNHAVSLSFTYHF